MEPLTVTDTSLTWLPLLLQTADALFPTGSYAHSLGFEEAVRLRLVRDEQSLRAFLSDQITPLLETCELPYLRFAYDAALTHEWQALAVLDQELGAAKPARETREASVRLGGRRLQALRNILPGDPYLTACGEAIASGRMAGHQAVVCGVQAAALGVPLPAALSAYCYQAIAAVSSASLKLIRIGQEGVQRALSAVCREAGPTVARSLLVTRDEAGWFDPLLEIASMRHERAEERLFIS